MAALLVQEEPKALSPAVAAIGLPAVPVLLAAIESHPAGLAWLGWSRADPQKTARARLNALVLFSDWGPEAKAALPTLVKVADRSEPGWELAMLAAATVAPDAPAVRDLLVAKLEGTAESRASAALVIHHCRLRDARFVGPLAAALKDIRVGRPLDRLPVKEMLALSRQGSEASAAVPELIQGWEIAELRGALLVAFLELGREAAPAVPLLAETLNDDRSRPMWPEVLHVLARIGPGAEPAATALSGRLQHPDPLIRGMAALAAASIRQSTNFAVTALLEQLQDTNYANARATLPLRLGDSSPGLGHREAAAWFLGEMGPPAAEALPALRSLQRESNIWLRLFSARAVWRISGEAEPVLEVLERELGGDNEISGVWVCQLAAELGPRARGVEALLRKAMTRNLKLRAAALAALQTISAS